MTSEEAVETVAAGATTAAAAGLTTNFWGAGAGEALWAARTCWTTAWALLWTAMALDGESSTTVPAERRSSFLDAPASSLA